MGFYIKKDMVLPAPTKVAIYSEVVRLEKLFAQQFPYSIDVFTIIYNRCKRCEEWLWLFGDHNTSQDVRYMCDVFQQNVQNAQNGRRYEAKE